MKLSFIATASIIAAANAQQSICDKYTTALFKGKGGNSAANQQTLLTLLVNTVVIGNYSDINTGVRVPGILAPGRYAGEDVNLLPYFNGGLASTNTGGPCGVSVNFLDGGGAAPLMQNKPANSQNSRQYFLLTHLYTFFASLLGCSKYGEYTGTGSMYQVHKFMALNNAEVGYFIKNVGLSAASFGVTNDDVEAVGTALKTLFGYRCSPYKSIPPVPEQKLQSICIDCDCPCAPNKSCYAYAPVFPPKKKGQQATCKALQSKAQMCNK